MFDDEEELREACKLADIDIWEHELCSECKKALRGSFTYGDKGPLCFDCEHKKH